ncbi:hypothetical protein Tco_1041019 [Tanacetum coccineum]|uniref:Uncharacterized protein n=1 Tax=Tanacetum coccineum TaxID=301880 RepID=A0ABQ5GFW3_9ASTR
MTEQRNVGCQFNLDLVEMSNPEMHKYILEAKFERFSVSNTEGLHKGYDRFQSLLSSTASSSSPQNVAFVSENSSSTNEVSTAYCVLNLSGQNSKIDEYDLEEMDLKWQVSCINEKKSFTRRLGILLESVESRELKITGGEMHGILETRMGA